MDETLFRVGFDEVETPETKTYPATFQYLQYARKGLLTIDMKEKIVQLTTDGRVYAITLALALQHGAEALGVEPEPAEQELIERGADGIATLSTYGWEWAMIYFLRHKVNLKVLKVMKEAKREDKS